MNYLILTENDESAWDDNTGISYHFPYKYRSVIIEGSEIIYYNLLQNVRKCREK